MADLARKSIEFLRQQGASPTELRRLESALERRERWRGFHHVELAADDLERDFTGGVPKETPADLPGVGRICQSLVELSRNLFDIEAWQHYRNAGYESFEAYCTEVLHISAEQAERLKLIRERSLPQRGKKGPGPFFDWLFQAAEILVGAKKNDYL